MAVKRESSLNVIFMTSDDLPKIRAEIGQNRLKTNNLP